MNDEQKRARLARAESLETGLMSALCRLGYWCIRPHADAKSAPMWTIPKGGGAKTRAPDLIVLGCGIIELKESIIDQRGHVSLYTHQVRDYLINWPMLPLPATIWICASAGDYRGDVGVISLADLCLLDLNRDRVSLSLMSLFYVGTYRGNTFSLSGDSVSRVLVSQPITRNIT